MSNTVFFFNFINDNLSFYFIFKKFVINRFSGGLRLQGKSSKSLTSCLQNQCILNFDLGTAAAR